MYKILIAAIAVSAVGCGSAQTDVKAGVADLSAADCLVQRYVADTSPPDGGTPLSDSAAVIDAANFCQVQLTGAAKFLSTTRAAFTTAPVR